MYKSSWRMYSYHDGKCIFPWLNWDGFSDMPKDGDKCKYCGREILIVEGYIHRLI